MTADAASTTRPIRPLSILHLLVWTTFTAVSLACASGNPFQLPPNEDFSRVVSLSLYTLLAMADGAALTGMAFLLPSLFSNVCRGRMQPGHWILVSWGILSSVSLLWNAGMGIWLMDDNGVWSMGHLTRAYSSLAHGGAGIVLAIAWRTSTTERPWPVYFLLRTISAGLFGLVGIAETITYIVYCVDQTVMFETFEIVIVGVALLIGSLLEFAGFVTFVVAAIRDWSAGRYRDWLHQAAVILVMAWPVLVAINWFGMQLYYSMSRN